MNLISFEVSSSLISTNLLFVYRKQFLTTLLLEVFDMRNIYFTARHFSPFTSLSIIVLVHKYYSGYCVKVKDYLQANM